MPTYLNNIDEKQLEMIKKLATLFFIPKEIAFMVELDEVEFVEQCKEVNKGSMIYKAFHGGRLQGELDLRTDIMKLAKAGSTPAQTMAFEILKLSKTKMM